MRPFFPFISLATHPFLQLFITVILQVYLAVKVSIGAEWKVSNPSLHFAPGGPRLSFLQSIGFLSVLWT